MKFGKELERTKVDGWEWYYIDYADLKRFLKHKMVEAPGGQTFMYKEAEFYDMLVQNLDRVSYFSFLKYDEILSAIANMEETIDNILTAEHDVRAALFRRLESLIPELEDITEAVNKLDRFNRTNFTGFYKILKKHDKQTGVSLRYAFQQEMDKRPFFKFRFDDMIAEISKLYQKIKAGDDDATWVPGTSFVRKTTKYWVHADNLTKVKLAIMKHLPVLRFQEDPDTPFEPHITSIYYDNEDLDLYHGRMRKDEGAEAIRLRWYGTMANQVFFERKTHHEDWTGYESVKERFMVSEKHVDEVCDGTYGPDRVAKKVAKRKKSQKEVDATYQLAYETQQSIINKKLKPCVRTYYKRTAFQLPTSNTVRISLDEDLTMVDEMNKTGGRWRRDEVGVEWPFSHINSEDVILFPYAVLEVKLSLRQGEDPPTWIANLIESPYVECVPKFSKFMHGCATLHESKCQMYPYWLPQMDTDIRKSPEEVAEYEERIRADASTSSQYSPTEDGSIGEQERLKPKLIFANERTFMKWLHMSLFVATGGLVLLDAKHVKFQSNAKLTRITGIIMTSIACIFVLAAGALYLRRRKLIAQKYVGSWNEYVMTVTMALVFLAAMAATFVVRIGELVN
eukprot:Clim_evm37s230 gene=Clim_evmTU37s230